MPLPLLAIASLALGAYQTFEGKRGLDAMGNKPVDEVTPEEQAAYSGATSRAGYGYSGDQVAALEQERSMGENTAFHKAYDASGGNQGGAINAALKSFNILSRNKQAFEDASLQENKQRYADSRGDVISRHKERITGQKRQDWGEKAQAYGNAMQTGLTNMTNFFNMNQALGAYKDAASAGGDHNIIMGEITRNLRMGNKTGQGDVGEEMWGNLGDN